MTNLFRLEILLKIKKIIILLNNFQKFIKLKFFIKYI